MGEQEDLIVQYCNETGDDIGDYNQDAFIEWLCGGDDPDDETTP